MNGNIGGSRWSKATSGFGEYLLDEQEQAIQKHAGEYVGGASADALVVTIFRFISFL